MSKKERSINAKITDAQFEYNEVIHKFPVIPFACVWCQHRCYYPLVEVTLLLLIAFEHLSFLNKWESERKS